MKTKRIIAIFAVLLLAAAFFTACAPAQAAPASGSPAAASSAAASGSAAPAADVKTVTVGTGNAFKPYCYLDENGSLQGYEKAVLDAVNAKLPQYKFKYDTYDFKNILIGLEAKKLDLAAHQFEKNPEREAKYLYSAEPYTTFILRIVVKKDRNDIKSLDDLAGKKLKVAEGSNDAYVVGEWNKAHGNAINVVVSSEDAATTVKNIENGTYDAFISITRVVADYNKTYGDLLKTVGEPIATSSTYFIFRKDETDLQANVDRVLKELKADGTLSKISTDILGADYTTND
jgi:L-cystine transport system substrate-binding protein